jgi:GT2 family glycosyltransferase
MLATSVSHSPSSILAILVLYNRELSQSQSGSSLLRILNDSPELAKHFSLVLYDNSPHPQTPEIAAGYPICYIHDPSNGGLASAYNFALQRAESEEREWLLLLDQDTSLTPEFVLELVQATGSLHSRSEVAAIVPKLQVNGRIDSPAADLFHQMRRQFLRPEQSITRETVGIQKQSLCSYNSGSALRVTALRSTGGFPSEFWLDFLDHAVFHALFINGFRVYVLRSILEHDSSYSDIGSVPIWRLRNIILARTLYVRKSGTFVDRVLYRIWLLRHSRNLRQSCKDPTIWREATRQALGYRLAGDSGARKDKRLLT